MSRSVLTTLRDWTGLVASIATVLFLTFYPHASTSVAHGSGSYRAAVAGSRDLGPNLGSNFVRDLGRSGDAEAGAVTAELIDRDAALRH